jgi:hypothetical protein
MSKKPIQDIPEDEEIDMGEEDEEIDMEEGFDLVEALGQMLCTEEGDTLATTLVSIKESTEKIATQLEMQNRILVKIVGALTKPPAPAPAA